VQCQNSTQAVKQVLAEAAEASQCANSSEAERLVWMLERAFMLGVGATRAGEPRPGTSRDSVTGDQTTACSFGPSPDEG
jgi:hypothetical protein